MKIVGVSKKILLSVTSLLCSKTCMNESLFHSVGRRFLLFWFIKKSNSFLRPATELNDLSSWTFQQQRVCNACGKHGRVHFVTLSVTLHFECLRSVSHEDPVLRFLFCLHSVCCTVPGGFSTANSRSHFDSMTELELYNIVFSKVCFVCSDEELVIPDLDSLIQGMVFWNEFSSFENSS